MWCGGWWNQCNDGMQFAKIEDENCAIIAWIPKVDTYIYVSTITFLQRQLKKKKKCRVLHYWPIRGIYLCISANVTVLFGQEMHLQLSKTRRVHFKWNKFWPQMSYMSFKKLLTECCWCHWGLVWFHNPLAPGHPDTCQLGNPATGDWLNYQ